MQRSPAFARIAVGRAHACGLIGPSADAPGLAYCWGTNRNGRLGDGSAVPAWIWPRLVSPDLHLAAITAGESHTCGITLAGEAYC